MSDAEQHRSMDAHDLYRSLDRFINDNCHSGNVEYRWLADQAIALKTLAYDLHANGIGSFGKKHNEPISKLRLSEIERERAKLAVSDSRLAEEEQKLKRGIAA